MRCPLGYHWNELTLKVHRPDCSHPAKVYCHPLPKFVDSLGEALDRVVQIHPRATSCEYCFEEEIREIDARIFR